MSEINQNWPSELSNQVMFFLNRQQIIEHSDGQECLMLLGHHFCVNGSVAAKKFGVNMSEVWRFRASWQHIRVLGKHGTGEEHTENSVSVELKF